MLLSFWIAFLCVNFVGMTHHQRMPNFRSFHIIFFQPHDRHILFQPHDMNISSEAWAWGWYMIHSSVAKKCVCWPTQERSCASGQCAFWVYNDDDETILLVVAVLVLVERAVAAASEWYQHFPARVVFHHFMRRRGSYHCWIIMSMRGFVMFCY